MKRKREVVSGEFFIVKRSAIHNQGVFAKKNISKGTRIIEYIGEKITNKEATRRSTMSLSNHRENNVHGAVYTFEINKRYSIDGDVPYNLARHINHSCDPNAETDVIRGRIWIIAIRDIKKGEEITYNYGYDLDMEYEEHPCRCGTDRCVGYILNEEFWPELKNMKIRGQLSLKVLMQHFILYTCTKKGVAYERLPKI